MQCWGVICNEALCGLDLPFQADMMAHLTSMRKASGMALLFISHDRGSTVRMCSRVITLLKKKSLIKGLVDLIPGLFGLSVFYC